MKKLLKNKNVLLFLVLILLLVGTYIFEERGTINKKFETDRASQLLDTQKMGDLVSIKANTINLVKRGEFFYDPANNIVVSDLRLDEYFTILSSLRTIKSIPQEEIQKAGLNQFIPENAPSIEFGFDKGFLKFTLGAKVQFDQSFYMQVTKENREEVYLVQDISADPGAYQSEEDYRTSDVKYKRVLYLFYLTNKYFYDTQIFRGLDYKEDKINFDEMAISTFRNKKFLLDFKKTQTLPIPPKSVGYFEDNWISFHQFLTNLEGKEIIYPFEKKQLDEVVSHFEIKDRTGKKIDLLLYKTYQKKPGYYLTTSLSDYLYEIDGKVAQHFFVNIQDFWNKKFWPSEKNYSLKLDFYNGKSLSVNVEDGALFKVSDSLASQVKYKQLAFKKLVDYLKTGGDFVEEMSIKQSDLLKNRVMSVVFNKKVFDVILEDNGVIILDQTNQVLYHFYSGMTLPFGIKLEDYKEDK